MAGEAGLILLEWLSLSSLWSGTLQGAENTEERYQQPGGKGRTCMRFGAFRLHSKLPAIGRQTAWEWTFLADLSTTDNERQYRRSIAVC